MQKLMRLKKDKKGFTLTEIIVVLVILAVLAAATIPTMLGMVEEARGKAYVAEARAGLVAAQAIASEEYAAKGTASQTIGDTAIKDMIGDDSIDGTFSDVTATNGKVGNVVYTVNGYVITITPGESAVVTKSGS